MTGDTGMNGIRKKKGKQVTCLKGKDGVRSAGDSAEIFEKGPSKLEKVASLRSNRTSHSLITRPVLTLTFSTSIRWG